MLYDQHGKVIPEPHAGSQSFGQRVFVEPSDRQDYDVSRGLTPYDLDRIMIAANGGEPSELCRLCLELEEKNWDIVHAIGTRRDALTAVGWEVEPGGDSPADEKAAKEFTDVLKSAGGLNGLDSFNSLLSDLTSSLLPGFSVSEIVWKEGGGVSGFEFIDQHHFTFRNGKEPCLITRDSSLGVELEPNKYIIHKYRRRGGDVTRGGLIRSLAWLHCFSSVNVKDLLSFVERYGMPFVVAKIDDQTWKNERDVLKGLIRNFGPSGGGLFSRSVELELLQATNNTGEVYFKLLEYIDKAITKVILGQTATAGDGGGWSSDSAQAQVRQDILEADCKGIGDTVTMQLAAPWTMYTQPPGTKTPQIILPCKPPEDEKAHAETNELHAKTVKTLHEAGLEADAAEMSEKFGMKLRRVVTTPKKDTIAMAAEPLHPAASVNPGSAGLQAGKENADVTLIDNTAAEIINTGAADAWLGPIEKEISNISGLSDEEFIKKLKALPDDSLAKLFNASDSGKLREILENEIYAAAADGIANKTKELKNKKPDATGK